MKNRKHLTRYRSGGIALLVKQHILPYIRIVNSESKLILWFSVSKEILPITENLICGVLYIPPAGSKYAHPDPYLELQAEFDRFCLNSSHVLLFGDFNSRTATLSDFIESDSFIFEMYGNTDLQRERDSIFQVFEKFKNSATPQ